MFERPPTILEPTFYALANLAGWFNWSALEAIGTVGALWFAVVQGSRNTRLERVRAIGLLTTLIGLTEPLIDAITSYVRDTGELLDELGRSELEDVRLLSERALRGLRSIPISEFAAAGVAEYAGPLDFDVELLHRELPPSTDGLARRPAKLGSGYLYEAHEFFVEQRDFLRYGRIAVALDRAAQRLRQMALARLPALEAEVEQMRQTQAAHRALLESLRLQLRQGGAAAEPSRDNNVEGGDAHKH